MEGLQTVYYGYMDGSAFAVKIMKDSLSKAKIFIAEIEILLRIHHRNLVSLVGYCEEGNNLILVHGQWRYLHASSQANQT